MTYKKVYRLLQKFFEDFALKQKWDVDNILWGEDFSNDNIHEWNFEYLKTEYTFSLNKKHQIITPRIKN